MLSLKFFFRKLRCSPESPKRGSVIACNLLNALREDTPCSVPKAPVSLSKYDLSIRSKRSTSDGFSLGVVTEPKRYALRTSGLSTSSSKAGDTFSKRSFRAGLVRSFSMTSFRASAGILSLLSFFDSCKRISSAALILTTPTP